MSLETVPLFCTYNVAISYMMFAGCTSLTAVPNFDFENNENYKCMFSGCDELFDVIQNEISRIVHIIK